MMSHGNGERCMSERDSIVILGSLLGSIYSSNFDPVKETGCGLHPESIDSKLGSRPNQPHFHFFGVVKRDHICQKTKEH